MLLQCSSILLQCAWFPSDWLNTVDLGPALTLKHKTGAAFNYAAKCYCSGEQLVGYVQPERHGQAQASARPCGKAHMPHVHAAGCPILFSCCQTMLRSSKLCPSRRPETLLCPGRSLQYACLLQICTHLYHILLIVLIKAEHLVIFFDGCMCDSTLVRPLQSNAPR